MSASDIENDQLRLDFDAEIRERRAAVCERDAARRERDEASAERDAAIRERDKARREACDRTAENLSLLGSSVRLSTLRIEHAARRGWDCFKDETQ